MRGVWRIVIGLVLCTVMVGPLVPLRRARAQSPEATETLRMVNEYRAAHGLPPYAMNGALMAAAQQHVDWMVANNSYGHTGAGGSTPAQRAAAAGYTGVYVWENWVSSRSPAGAVQWWSSSPVHNEGLLLPNHTDAGVGYADGTYVLLMGQAAPPKPPTQAGPPGPTDTPGPIIIPVSRSAPREDGSVWHVVQMGQTFWDVAAVYGVSLDELLALNSMDRSSVVYPGDELLVKLGEGQAPPPTATPQLIHVVQEGETPWTVAALHGLTLDELLDINGLKRGDIVKPGDELRLWVPEPTATPTETPTITPTPVPPTLTPTATDTPPPTLTPSVTPFPSATLTLTATTAAVAASRTPEPTSLTPASIAIQVAEVPTAASDPLIVETVPQTNDSGISAGDQRVLIAALAVIAGIGIVLAAGGAWIILRSR